MRRSFVSSAVVIAASALALTAGSAQAVFSVTFNGVSPSVSVSLSKNSGSTFSNYTAGRFNLTGDASAPAGLQGAFSGFCIDINQSISSGNTYTDFVTAALSAAPTPGTAMGTTKANYIAELWANERAGLTSADQYAAFQVCVWEIVNDTGLSLTAGTFRAASSTVRTIATGFLAKLDGLPPVANVFAITSGTTQDFVVPAPATASLALGGMLFGMGRRRRTAK